MRRFLVLLSIFLSGIFLLLVSGMSVTAQGMPPDPTFWPFFTAIWCLIPLISIIIWVVVAVWVYRDANERGMTGGLWAIVIIVGGLVGLIVYMILRRDHPKYGEPGYGFRPGYHGYYQQPYYGYGPRYPPPGYPPPRYPPY